MTDGDAESETDRAGDAPGADGATVRADGGTGGADAPDAERDHPLRIAWAIARAEQKRQEHRHATSRRKKALVAIAVAAYLPILLGILLGVHAAGAAVADGKLPGLLEFARWTLPGSFALIVVFGAIQARKPLVDFGARKLHLTAVSDRDLALGLLLSGVRSIVVYGGASTALLFAAFAHGAGTFVPAVVGPIAAVTFVAAGVLAGFVVGLLARLGLARVPLSPRARSLLKTGGTVVAALLGAGVGGLIGKTSANVSGGLSLSALTPDAAAPPVPTHYADWLFVGTPIVDGVGLAAVGSALLVAASIPLSVACALALAPRLWRADPATPADDAEDEEQEQTDAAASGGFLGESGSLPLLDVRTAVVVRGLFRRVARRPGRFAFVGYYVVLVGMVAVPSLTSPEAAPTAVGASLVLLGLWFAGGVFGLNPLGEEGSMLGQLVLSDAPERTFVRARIVAGVALGAPLVVLGTGLLAVDALSPRHALGFGAYWLALLPVSAGAAVGVGTLLPNAERAKVLDAVETLPPEPLAIVAHGAATMALAVAGPLLILAAPSAVATAGGAALLALGAVVLADGGYRFAVAGMANRGRSRPADPVLAVEIAVGLVLLGAVLSSNVGGVGALVPLEGTAGEVFTFVAAYVGWGVAVVGYLLLADRRDYLDVRAPTRDDLRVAAAGTVASFAVYGLVVAGHRFAGLPMAGHSLGERAAEVGPSLALALAVLAVTVNAPVEELFFRNVVQKRLAEAIPERAAVGGAGVLFGLAHLPAYASGDPLGVAVTVGLLTAQGVIWGAAFARTDNAVVPALCHGAYNAALFGALFVAIA